MFAEPFFGQVSVFLHVPYVIVKLQSVQQSAAVVELLILSADLVVVLKVFVQQLRLLLRQTGEQVAHLLVEVNDALGNALVVCGVVDRHALQHDGMEKVLVSLIRDVASFVSGSLISVFLQAKNN